MLQIVAVGEDRAVRAVERLRDFLPPGVVRSIVVFTGDAEFQTELPRGVVMVSELIGYLKGQTDEVMSVNRVQFCVGRIETARLAITHETDVEHIQNLARRRRGAR